MPTIRDPDTKQAVHVCDGCGKVVGVLTHPYALSNMFGPKPLGTRVEDTGAAFASCMVCNLSFVACVACGGSAHNDVEKSKHMQDNRAHRGY